MTAARIAALNDRARSTFTACRMVLTPGAAALEDVGEAHGQGPGVQRVHRGQ